THDIDGFEVSLRTSEGRTFAEADAAGRARKEADIAAGKRKYRDVVSPREGARPRAEEEAAVATLRGEEPEPGPAALRGEEGTATRRRGPPDDVASRAPSYGEFLARPDVRTPAKDLARAIADVPVERAAYGLHQPAGVLRLRIENALGQLPFGRFREARGSFVPDPAGRRGIKQQSERFLNRDPVDAFHDVSLVAGLVRQELPGRRGPRPRPSEPAGGEAPAAGGEVSPAR